MARPRSWTDADLRAAVEGTRSIAGVIRALGLHIGGAMYIIKEGLSGRAARSAG